MIIISQNTFLILGVLLFCLFRGAIKVKGIIKGEYTYKKYILMKKLSLIYFVFT